MLNSSISVCNISRSPPPQKAKKNPIHHIGCDLGNPGAVAVAAERVGEFLEQQPPGRVWLLNNSGFGCYGHFPGPGLSQNLEMIDVNVRGAVHLTGLLLPELKKRGGAIGNVASTAAFQPTAYLSVYGATKVFLLHWSLALGRELKGEGVTVSAICPGPTRSAFFERAGLAPELSEGRGRARPEAVARAMVRAMAAGAPLCVPGFWNKALAFASGRLPKPLTAAIGESILRRHRMGKSGRR